MHKNMIYCCMPPEREYRQLLVGVDCKNYFQTRNRVTKFDNRGAERWNSRWPLIEKIWNAELNDLQSLKQQRIAGRHEGQGAIRSSYDCETESFAGVKQCPLQGCTPPSANGRLSMAPSSPSRESLNSRPDSAIKFAEESASIRHILSRVLS